MGVSVGVGAALHNSVRSECLQLVWRPAARAWARAVEGTWSAGNGGAYGEHRRGLLGAEADRTKRITSRRLVRG